MANMLQDRVAVITGSSRGLGLAIAQAYARQGAQVVISSRTARTVAQAVDNLRAAGAQVTGLPCDVGDIVQVQALARHALDTFGRMDIWVNNAGLSAPYGATAHIPSDAFLPVIQTNITGTYNGSVIALRHFIPQKRGKLINLLGRGDDGSVKWQNGYSSSKVWVRNFTRALAAEYKNSGVDIFGFNPGLVRTEMLGRVDVMSGFENKVSPLRVVATLWGNNADVPAEKAAWLASDATNGKTGQMVSVLTRGFMFKRMFTRGIPMLFGRVQDMHEMEVISVPSVPELAAYPPG